MTGSRRSLFAALTLFVLQLSLLGAAAPCAHHLAQMEKTSGAAPAGHASCGDDAEEADAHTPASETQACPMMAACSATMVQLPAAPIVAAAVSVLVREHTRATELATRVTAPELPPPRG